ncbi:MAG TPA: hypothetical protein VH599_01120 [Ktedonobacterales bacterium]|jgi:photosystem II stability/assembly factor-like uncharacterized protein
MGNFSHSARTERRRGWFARLGVWWVLVALTPTLLLGACSNSQPNPGFGDQKNHIHAMLALPGKPGLVLLATHYGLFRTTDGGKTWQKVMGGPGQLAEGLMTQYLTVSPLDPQRVYVEAITFSDLPKSSGVPGIYTSADGGATWSLMTALSNLPSPAVYYMAAGIENPQQLYIYMQGLQKQGLYETLDAGVRWQPLGALPDTQSLGLLVDPTKAGHLFVYSEEGLFASEDNGAHWKAAPGIKDGIFKALLNGSLIYASGDDGTFVSQDGGAHFTLTAQNLAFQFLSSSPTTPTTAYGVSGSSFYQTTDGGQHWQNLKIPASRLFFASLSVEPSNSQQVYLGNSYPVTVYASSNGGQQWSQVAP